jgi:hypothetical protein
MSVGFSPPVPLLDALDADSGPAGLDGFHRLIGESPVGRRLPGSWSWCARSPSQEVRALVPSAVGGAPRDATDGGAERQSLRGGYASGRPPVPRGAQGGRPLTGSAELAQMGK